MARLVYAALLLAASLCVAHAAPSATDEPSLSVNALVAAATKYVTQYEQEFAFLVADESYSQAMTGKGGKSQTRLLESEIFLAYLPADNEWLAVRDVIKVDGLPVAGREELRTLLARREELRGLIAQVIRQNARFNIGEVTRNFNEPTLPLLLFDSKRVGDVKFERKTVVKNGNITLATLAFTERGRPTLVRGPLGAMPGKGELTVEAGTGIVRRTRLELEQGPIKAALTTEYAKEPRLNLWLPSVFTERYVSGSPFDETVECRATYANYRRFEVNGRIK